MNNDWELPLAVDLRAMKLAQEGIVRALNGQGLSFEAIASEVGVSGSALRNFFSQDRSPRRDNEVLKAIHFALTSEGTRLSSVAAQIGAADYADRFTIKQNSTAYRAELSTLARICHDLFNPDEHYPHPILKLICGNYVVFKKTAVSGLFSKGRMSIEEAESDDPSYQFTLVNPNEYSLLLPSEEPFTTISGTVVKEASMLQFMGSAPRGGGSHRMTVSCPTVGALSMLSGYAIRSAADRGILSTEVLLIKNPDSTQEEIYCRSWDDPDLPSQDRIYRDILRTPQPDIAARNSSQLKISLHT